MSSKNRIADVRKMRGLSQAKLAKMLGVAQNTVSNWENGAREPDNENLKKLAQALGCTVDYLLCLDTASSDFPPDNPKIPSNLLQHQITPAQLIQAIKNDPDTLKLLLIATAKALESELEEGEEIVKGIGVLYPPFSGSNQIVAKVDFTKQDSDAEEPSEGKEAPNGFIQEID